MSPENTKHLYKKYPILYKGRTKPITESLMAFGFECGDGWFNLIDQLSAKLEVISNEATSPVEATQVKEKFASLRFYVGGVPPEKADEIWGLISLAEKKSAITCEDCGKPGEVRGTGWVYCRCDDCWKEIEKSRGS